MIVVFAVFLAVKAFEAMQNMRAERGRGAKTSTPTSDFTVDQELLTEIRDLLRERA